MTTLGQTFFVLAVQVLLVASIALVASRRRAAAVACSPLVLGTCLILLLTTLAFLPRPTWARSTVSPPSPSVADAPPAPATVASPVSPTGVDVLELLRQLRPKHVDVTPTPTPSSAWTYWAWGVLALAAFGLMRLLCAWLYLRRVVRAAMPIDDANLQHVCAELRQTLGCRSVRVCETAIAGAATVGWWRPVILLGHEWRTWTAVQLRAVLAHEFAHVRRRDYLTRLLVRGTTALHGYQPVVHWLAVRLEEQQELAADALAAPLVGGPKVYAQALAALALQADGRRVALAPSVLSRPQTLLRRIGMLRVMDDTQRTGRRWPSLLLVIAMALGALALHGRTADVFAGPIIPAKFVEAKRAPLDYTYLQATDTKDGVGMCLVRVGELATMPGMEQFVAAYGENFKNLLGDKKLPCSIKDIEQIGGRMAITHQPDKPAPNRSLSISLSMVRATKDVDWVAFVKELGTEFKEHTHAGTTYYSSQLELPIFPKKTPFFFYVPDKRTLVLESETAIKQYIDAKKTPLPKPAWASSWANIEGSLGVMVLPNPQGKLAKLLTPDATTKNDTEGKLVATYGVMVAQAEHAVIAFDSDTSCRLTMHFACADAKAAERVDAECQKFTKLLTDEVLKDVPFVKEHPVQAMIRRGVDFGKNVEHHVGLEFTLKSSLADLVKAASGDAK